MSKISRKGTMVFHKWWEKDMAHLARMELKYGRRKVNNQNMNEVVQRMTEEARVASLMPNPQPRNQIFPNPGRQIEKSGFEAGAPDVFGEDKFLQANFQKSADGKPHLGNLEWANQQYKSCVTTLLNLYMEAIFKLDRRQKTKDLTDSSRLSPYQYARKMGKKASAAELARNELVDRNRVTRLAVAGILNQVLSLFFRATPSDWKQFLIWTGITTAPPEQLKSEEFRSSTVKALVDAFNQAYDNRHVLNDIGLVLDAASRAQGAQLEMMVEGESEGPTARQRKKAFTKIQKTIAKKNEPKRLKVPKISWWLAVGDQKSHEILSSKVGKDGKVITDKYGVWDFEKSNKEKIITFLVAEVFDNVDRKYEIRATDQGARHPYVEPAAPKLIAAIEKVKAGK